MSNQANISCTWHLDNGQRKLLNLHPFTACLSTWLLQTSRTCLFWNSVFAAILFLFNFFIVHWILQVDMGLKVKRFNVLSRSRWIAHNYTYSGWEKFAKKTWKMHFLSYTHQEVVISLTENRVVNRVLLEAACI